MSHSPGDCPAYPASCLAARHGRRCHAADDFQKRLQRRRDRDVHELLTVKQRVYDLLLRFPDARDSDIKLFEHYFREYDGLPQSLPWTEFLAFITKTYHGNVTETLRRRRAEHQAAGLFPACDEVAADRAAREVRYQQEFGAGPGKGVAA